MKILYDELVELLMSLGVPETWIPWMLLFAVLSSIGALNPIFKGLSWTVSTVNKMVDRIRHDQDTKDYIAVRNRFAKHLIVELERQNLDTDWNDFYYTKLQAEVDVDSLADLELKNQNIIVAWIKSISTFVPLLLGVWTGGRSADNLLEAISQSASRAFLVIGDPGSGKTVSLRHLALELAEKCVKSNNKSTTVPLYLNLKSMDVPFDEISGDTVRKWVVEQLRAGHDHLINQFLEKHFDRMLDDGNFFFLFDSFDEIPAVLDHGEDARIVRGYADALNRFLHTLHACRGLVASRPYRAPKIFIGQRMTIKPLNHKKIKLTLRKYLANNSPVSKTVWQELISTRDDLLGLISNPFYLGLLARFASEHEHLPSRRYDLFENFITNRVEWDEERLLAFGLNSKTTLELASTLAFLMLKTPNIGLESDLNEILSVIAANKSGGLSKSNVENLMRALSYSKLGGLTNALDGSNKFSFVHRRFHEYFCARFLRDTPESAPMETAFADNRWREVLVLLCEVLPKEQLGTVFSNSLEIIKSGLDSSSNKNQHQAAIENLRFLKDAFRSRVEEIPDNLRQESAKFIENQFIVGNLLDQKRSIEGMVIADDNSIPSLFEAALNSSSRWLRETALRSGQLARKPTNMTYKKLRQHLYMEYGRLDLIRTFRFYYALFSFTSNLGKIRIFLMFLVGLSIYHWLVIIGILLYSASLQDFTSVVLLVATFILSFASAVYRFRPEQERKIDKPTRKDNEIVKESVLSDYLWSNHWFVFWILSFIFFGVVPLSITSNLPNNFLLWFISSGIVLNVIPIILFQDVTPSNIMRSWSTLSSWFKKAESYAKIGVGIIVAAVLGAVLRSVQILADFDYSLQSLRESYPQYLAIPIFFIGGGLLALTLVAVIMGFIVSFIPMLQRSLSMVKGVTRFIYEQQMYTMMIVRPNRRPQFAKDAVEILGNIQTNIVKIQYVKSLAKWLTPREEWEYLLSAAEKEAGLTRDVLFQLSELWQDATRN